MKKLIGFGIAAMMVMGLAGAASAAIDPNWLVVLKAVNTGGIGNGSISCGTKTGDIDGWSTASGQDALQGSVNGAKAIITSDVYTANLVAKDSRAPLTTADIAAGGKKWNLSVWQVDANGAKVAGNITIIGYISGVSGMTIDEGTNVGIKGPWVGDDGKGNLDYWFPHTGAANGSLAAPLFTRTVYYNGVDNVQLQLVAVPEPGSMVAMFSGLVGLVGFGIRRRK